MSRGGRLLDSLCRIMNDPLERIIGNIMGHLRECISFALCVQRRREGDQYISEQYDRFIPIIHF